MPADAVVGEPGKGMRVALGTLDVFRTTVGAAALGFARRALDEAIAHVKQRVAFGKPLAEFQLTQARIADMAHGHRRGRAARVSRGVDARPRRRRASRAKPPWRSSSPPRPRSR